MFVFFIDANGVPSATASARITVDQTPPGVAFATVGYVTDYTRNPLTSVQVAAVGTTITVTVLASKPLDTSVAPTLVASNGAMLPFTLSAASTGSCSFYAKVPAGLPDGIYLPALSWQDTLGNAATVTFSTPAIIVKTSVPAAPDARAGGPISYVRIPWGSASTRGQPAFVVTGGENALPEPGTAIVYATKDGPDGTPGELGRSATDATGAFTAQLTEDRPVVYVASVDVAGNVSPPPLPAVHSVTWTATFGSKTPGQTFPNPNVLQIAQSFHATSSSPGLLGPLLQDPNTTEEAMAYSQIGVPQTSLTLPLVVTATQAPTWQYPLTAPPNPVPRFQDAMAYDAVRGVAVLFGGTDGTNLMADTWERSGPNWKEVVPATSPPPRYGHAMAYDAKNGVTLLFGGVSQSASALADTWLWDGTTWTDVSPGFNAPAGPSGRSGHAMVYDATRGVVVLFGGSSGGSSLNDTWEWNGSVWSNVTPSAGNPGARSGQAMAFDSIRGVTVLFGGQGIAGPLADTWEWNGQAWTNVTPQGTGPISPPARSGHGLVYDAARAVTFLFAGTQNGNESDDSWTWDGTHWTNVTPSGVRPPMRAQFGMAYDSSRGVAIVFSGLIASDTNATWEWNGSAWRNESRLGSPVPTVANLGMAYDAALGASVLFGTSSPESNDLWSWDGNAWAFHPGGGPALPSTRDQDALVYDSTRGVLVLFGGFSNHALNDTWEYDGSVWTQVALTGPVPPARKGHAMAYDSGRGVTVLFGGAADDGSTLGDTWEWNGQTWSDVTPVSGTGPVSRSQHAMAYDAGRGVTLLFGGSQDGLHEMADTWTWNGTAWTQMMSSVPNGGRLGHSMTYDSVRGVTVLFGGEVMGQAVNDVWEWDGSRWAVITPAGQLPSARTGAALAYDPGREVVVLAGGLSQQGVVSDTWELPANPELRPAEVAQFAFGSAATTKPVIEQMSITAWLGGAGNLLSVPGPSSSVSGGTIAVWDAWAGTWKAVSENTSGASMPSQISYTTASATEARRYLFSPEAQQTITLAMLPTAGSGSGVIPPEVAVGYVELSVSYQQAQTACTGVPCACASDETMCPAQAAVCHSQGGCPGLGSICSDTQIDPLNCGGCGNVCTGGTDCVAGVCTCPPGGACTVCPAGRQVCAGTCTDITTDPQNCGVCGVACGPGQTCQSGSGGAPTCGCAVNETSCPSGPGNVCTDTSSDSLNCGHCGNVCSGTTCFDGVCGGCQNGTICSGQCVDPSSDPFNCGTCGNVCHSGQICGGGACH